MLQQDFEHNYTVETFAPAVAKAGDTYPKLDDVLLKVATYPGLTHYTFRVIGSVLWMSYLGRLYSYCGINRDGELFCLYNQVDGKDTEHWRVM